MIESYSATQFSNCIAYEIFNPNKKEIVMNIKDFVDGASEGEIYAFVYPSADDPNADFDTSRTKIKYIQVDKVYRFDFSNLIKVFDLRTSLCEFFDITTKLDNVEICREIK